MKKKHIMISTLKQEPRGGNVNTVGNNYCYINYRNMVLCHKFVTKRKIILPKKLLSHQVDFSMF